MAKECLDECPVIEKIKENVESNLLPEFFTNGLTSALRASDECQGPAEPLEVCGYFASIKDEITLTHE